MTQPWGQLVRRDHVLVAGMPGCGKTPFVADLVADARRVGYVDPTEEWAAEDLGERIDGGDLLDVLDDDGEPIAEVADEVADGLLRGTFRRVVVVPPAGHYPAVFRAFAAVCRAAGPRRLNLGPGIVMVGDEVHRLRAGGCEQLLAELHSDGHKDGVVTVLASPCMVHFPKQCRDTASRVYSFFQKNAEDVSAMRAEYGNDFATRAATWRHPQPPAEWVNPTLHE